MTSKRNSVMTIRNCRFAFKCDAVWENLDPLKNPKVRFCNTCSKSVYLCEDDAELFDNVVKNRCVAIFRSEKMLLGKIEDPAGFQE